MSNEQWPDELQDIPKPSPTDPLGSVFGDLNLKEFMEKMTARIERQTKDVVVIVTAETLSQLELAVNAAISKHVPYKYSDVGDVQRFDTGKYAIRVVFTIESDEENVAS